MNKIFILMTMIVTLVIGLFIGQFFSKEKDDEPAPISATNSVNKQPLQGSQATSLNSINQDFAPSGLVWQFDDIILGSKAGNEIAQNLLMADVIRLSDGGYRMFYNAGGKGTGVIKYADSSDGVASWTVGGIAVFGGTNPGDDDYIIGGSRVLQLGDGTYRMYYRATPDYTEGEPPSYSTYLATSIDGKTFTKQGVVIANSREQSNSSFSIVGHGAYYQLSDGTFAGWFSGNRVGQEGPSDLFFTTSIDGLHWTEPTLSYRGVHDPSVARLPDGSFQLMAMYLKEHAVTAVSSNGLEWPQQPGSVDLQDSTGKTMDLNMIGDFSLAVLKNGTLSLYSNYGSAIDGGIARYDTVSLNE